MPSTVPMQAAETGMHMHMHSDDLLLNDGV